MKKVTFYYLLLIALLTLPGCNNYIDEYHVYNINEPVFMPTSEFRTSPNIKQAEPIEQQGKIAFYNNYLYISSPGKGIHIIDNQDPANPQNVAFIELIGNADMHVRNNILYADSYIDLVWFDITDPEKPIFKGRKEEVFFNALPPTENKYNIDYNMASDRSKGIVTGWNLVERQDVVRSFRSWWWNWGSKDDTPDIVYDASPSPEYTSRNAMTGSMSRFAIYKDNLYTVMNNQMSIFTLSGEAPEKASDDIYVGMDVETIFNYKNCMFMGTPIGMIIFSLENPIIPEYQSMITHAFGCDPVVVENDIAYVTIRSGNFCGQSSDELIIIDVSDVKNPKQIVSYAMTGPKGLGIDNGTLFVCDDGLKVFNVEKPQNIVANKLAHFKDINGMDVIPYNNVLMMIAENGIYQYDYTDLNNITQLSFLPIGK